jgi:ApaG protein
MQNPFFVIKSESHFLADSSDFVAGRYLFVYTMTISNGSQTPAKLIARHWIITDANNKVQEVRGEGVIGEQPTILPGKTFQYSSNALLETPIGTMQGEYEFIGHHGKFLVEIPAFRLAVPMMVH